MQINTRAVKAVFELHGFGEIGVVRAADDFICHENCSQVDTGTKIGAHTRFFTIAASSGRKMSRTAALFPFSMILVSDWTFFFFFCSSRGCNFVSPPSPGGLLALVPARLTHQWLQEAVWKYWNNFSVRTRSTNEALLQISSCFIVLLGSWVSRCVLLVTTKASLTFYEHLASSTLTSSLHWLFALQEAFQRNRTSNHLLQSSLHSFNICVKKTVIML